MFKLLDQFLDNIFINFSLEGRVFFKLLDQFLEPKFDNFLLECGAFSNSWTSAWALNSMISRWRVFGGSCFFKLLDQFLDAKLGIFSLEGRVFFKLC